MADEYAREGHNELSKLWGEVRRIFSVLWHQALPFIHQWRAGRYGEIVRCLRIWTSPRRRPLFYSWPLCSQHILTRICCMSSLMKCQHLKIYNLIQSHHLAAFHLWINFRRLQAPYLRMNAVWFCLLQSSSILISLSQREFYPPHVYRQIIFESWVPKFCFRQLVLFLPLLFQECLFIFLLQIFGLVPTAKDICSIYFICPLATFSSCIFPGSGFHFEQSHFAAKFHSCLSYHNSPFQFQLWDLMGLGQLDRWMRKMVLFGVTFQAQDIHCEIF